MLNRAVTVRKRSGVAAEPVDTDARAKLRLDSPEPSPEHKRVGAMSRLPPYAANRPTQPGTNPASSHPSVIIRGTPLALECHLFAAKPILVAERWACLSKMVSTTYGSGPDKTKPEIGGRGRKGKAPRSARSCHEMSWRQSDNQTQVTGQFGASAPPYARGAGPKTCRVGTLTDTGFQRLDIFMHHL